MGNLNNKAIVRLQDPSSSKRGKVMFYVIDQAGNRKAVSIEFQNERIQKEVERRLKKSSIYQGTITIDKFNRIQERLMSALKELSDVDLDRLKSKIYRKEEQGKLDKLMEELMNLMKRMYQ